MDDSSSSETLKVPFPLKEGKEYTAPCASALKEYVPVFGSPPNTELGREMDNSRPFIWLVEFGSTNETFCCLVETGIGTFTTFRSIVQAQDKNILSGGFARRSKKHSIGGFRISDILNV
jgi:hypothetical protein